MTKFKIFLSNGDVITYDYKLYDFTVDKNMLVVQRRTGYFRKDFERLYNMNFVKSVILHHEEGEKQ